MVEPPEAEKLAPLPFLQAEPSLGQDLEVKTQKRAERLAEKRAGNL